MSTHALHGRCPYCEYAFAIAARARGETRLVHCLDCGEPFVVLIAVRVELAAVHGLASVDADAVLDRLIQREVDRAAAHETPDGIEAGDGSADDPGFNGAEPLTGRTTAGQTAVEDGERTADSTAVSATDADAAPSDGGADVRSAPIVSDDDDIVSLARPRQRAPMLDRVTVTVTNASATPAAANPAPAPPVGADAAAGVATLCACGRKAAVRNQCRTCYQRDRRASLPPSTRTVGALLNQLQAPPKREKPAAEHPALRDPPRRTDRFARRAPIAVKAREVNGSYGSSET